MGLLQEDHLCVSVVRGGQEAQEERRKVGRNDFQLAGWSSMLPGRIPVAESGWPVFGSWSFLVVERGLGPVLAVCLSAVSHAKHQT